MKVKNKSVLLLCAIFLFMFAIIFALSFAGGGTTVYAATTPKYTVHFAYSAWYKSNTTTTSTGVATDTTSARIRIGKSTYSTYSVELWGSGYSGTGDLSIGGYVNSSTINVKLNSTSGSPTLTIKNSSGTTVGSGTGTVTMSGLSDGTYSGSFSANGGWLVNNRQYDQAGFEAGFSFKIDTAAPTISGASTSTTGKYTSSAFTVSASDSASGVENLYMRAPNSSTYTAVGTSKTVAAGSTNGLYRFYAKDNAGNTSATYYVYYDNTAPTGLIKNSSGTTLTTNYTNQAFYYTASDSGSGINYLQYKTPSSSSWTTYASGTAIAATATNGKYTFRAVDKCGTYSEEKYIYLDTVKPTGTLYGGASTVSSGSTTNERYIKFVPSDTLSGVKACYVKEPNATSYSAYISGSQYSEAGTYSFYCVDNANNTSQTYTITLAESHTHSYTSQIIYPTCTTGGYTLYTCSCGSSYTDNAVGALGHNYSDWQTTQSATCTSSGVRSAVCSRCGATKTETVPALGHDYSVLVSSTGNSCVSAGSTTYKCSRCTATQTISGTALGHSYKSEIHKATCTEGGYTEHTCTRCGDNYIDARTAALGHNYITEIVEASCTSGGHILHKCTRCGDEYKTDVVPALGHIYIETVVEPTCTQSGGIYHTCTVLRLRIYD